ncbi:MAG: DEAD/DEAH box helicase [Dehalococcoidia bacterium]|nr:DEAD/DEAH box helicase [Dehalococcoidia bacterium]
MSKTAPNPHPAKGNPTLFRFWRNRKSSPEAAAPGEPSSQAEPAAHSKAGPAVAVAVATPEPASHEAPHEGATHEDGTPRRRRNRGGRRRRGTGAAAAGATAPTATHAAAPTARTLNVPEARAEISEAFRALGVDATGLDAIAALGFDDPTPIQAAALPLLLEGQDVVGLAQTGTGKTLAFGLPLARTIDTELNAVQAIVLVPTRELAVQVRDLVDFLGRFYGFSVLGLMGGRRVKSDLIALEKGAHVVVGTPGRIIDHMKRGTLSLREVRFAVLDEADQMLDIGFARDIDYILRVTPRDRQTALFSATMPESIGRLVYRYMRNAERVAVAPEQRTAEGVRQLYCEVAERDKFYALRYLYEQLDLGRSLIFRNTKIGVDRLTAQLQSAGVGARAIHGDLRQGERDRVMTDFRSGKLEFLVATNVAARGLDIPDIEHVINYDVPQNSEEYIHRIGRTARAGKTGTSVTLVSEWELDEFQRIQDLLGDVDVEYLEMPPTWD